VGKGSRYRRLEVKNYVLTLSLLAGKDPWGAAQKKKLRKGAIRKCSPRGGPYKDQLFYGGGGRIP